MATRTEIATLGRARFIEQLTSPFTSTVTAGVGDDMAVIDRGEVLELVGTTILTEGVDFDLSYIPLEHLGLKAVTAAVSNACAMNGVARYITVAIGISARFAVEEVEAIYRGVERGTIRYAVELIGGDTAPSMSGLTIAVTCIGEVSREKLTLRSGASPSELICTTGTLGAAYMGLQLLEREKRAGGMGDSTKSIFTAHKDILMRQLQPFARIDVIDELAAHDVLPTAMIDITSGLASAALALCRASGVGVRIHLSKMPVNGAVSQMAEELNADPIVAMLNGGDDFELLFTAPASAHDELRSIPDVNIIGFTTEVEMGAAIVTPDDEAIQIQSPEYK